MNNKPIQKIVKLTILIFTVSFFVVGTTAQSNYFISEGGEIESNFTSEVGGLIDEQISTDALPDGSFDYKSTIPLSTLARDMIIDQNGNFYIFYSDSYIIKVYDQSFTEIASIGVEGISGSDNSHFAGGQEYGGLFLDNDGLLYVSDYYNQRIQIFDTNNGYSYNATLDTQTFGSPSGVAVDSKGNIYVTFWSDVYIFNKDLTFSGNTLASADSHGLAIDNQDNKFIGNGESIDATVKVYDANNQPQAGIQRPSPTYTRPVVVRTDYQDNIYVVSDGVAGGLNIVDIYHSNRSYLGTIGKVNDPAVASDDNTRLNNPMDVATYGGSIFVLDYTFQRIQVFKNDITNLDLTANLTNGFTYSGEFNVTVEMNRPGTGEVFVDGSLTHTLILENSTNFWLNTLNYYDGIHFIDINAYAYDGNNTFLTFEVKFENAIVPPPLQEIHVSVDPINMNSKANETVRFDFKVESTFEHHMPDVTLYLKAKLNGIETILFEDSFYLASNSIFTSFVNVVFTEVGVYDLEAVLFDDVGVAWSFFFSWEVFPADIASDTTTDTPTTSITSDNSTSANITTPEVPVLDLPGFTFVYSILSVGAVILVIQKKRK
ncbi:MAG: hypothetical protein GPJ54_16900 [Candidatus Heimdallarchaeota archaeon]|nr:hypothetical protein [Candidatus Heimdallarchaeota archaeon]